jgi:hypothetical protein
VTQFLPFIGSSSMRGRRSWKRLSATCPGSMRCFQAITSSTFSRCGCQRTIMRGCHPFSHPVSVIHVRRTSTRNTSTSSRHAPGHRSFRTFMWTAFASCLLSGQPGAVSRSTEMRRSRWSRNTTASGACARLPPVARARESQRRKHLCCRQSAPLWQPSSNQGLRRDRSPSLYRYRRRRRSTRRCAPRLRCRTSTDRDS